MTRDYFKTLFLGMVSLFACFHARSQTQEQVQLANNPLARANAVGLENYYTPSLYGLGGMNANTLLHWGLGQPGFQLYAGLNFQFPVQGGKKEKK